MHENVRTQANSQEGGKKRWASARPVTLYFRLTEKNIKHPTITYY